MAVKQPKSLDFDPGATPPHYKAVREFLKSRFTNWEENSLYCFVNGNLVVYYNLPYREWRLGELAKLSLDYGVLKTPLTGNKPERRDDFHKLCSLHYRTVQPQFGTVPK